VNNADSMSRQSRISRRPGKQFIMRVSSMASVLSHID
jgi:hypothetical protein